jgi:uncharacterized RDD family membrane protein YckC
VHGRIANRTRLLAASIDLPILAAIVVGCAFAPSLVAKSLSISLAGALVGVALAECYSLLDLSRSGTPGKMLLSIRIASPTGRQNEDPNLILRWFLKFLPLHCLLLEVLYHIIDPTDTPALLIRIAMGIPYFAAAIIVVGYCTMFDDMRQSLHDILADTAVFDAHIKPNTTGFQVLAPDHHHAPPAASHAPIILR